MRVLLVTPEFPNSYWSGRYSLPIVRRGSILGVALALGRSDLQHAVFVGDDLPGIELGLDDLVDTFGNLRPGRPEAERPSDLGDQVLTGHAELRFQQ